MPMWARAIIFGIELVGFLVLSIFAIIKFYQRNKLEGQKKLAISNLKFDIIYFTINFVIILALFLLTFPSYVFLSYNKLLLVSIAELLSIILILIVLMRNEIIKAILLLSCIATFIATLAISAGMVIGMIKIENKVIISEQKEIQTITPTMFSKNQIGYTADDEGNIVSYMFYYQDKGEWKYIEVDVSDVRNKFIKDKDAYVEEAITRTSYCKQEKKANEEDYIYTEENVKYILYLNEDKMVKIKN